MNNISAQALREAAAITEQIEGLQSRLNSLLAGALVPRKKRGPKPKLGGDVDQWRQRQAGGGGQGIPKERKKRTMSAAGRAAIAKAAKARWAARKAAGKNSL